MEQARYSGSLGVTHGSVAAPASQHGLLAQLFQAKGIFNSKQFS